MSYCTSVVTILFLMQNMARIVEQTNEGREKAVEAKKDLQQQAAQKKDRLKAAFLKKQLDSLKAAKKKAGMTTAS